MAQTILSEASTNAQKSSISPEEDVESTINTAA
jgi:hypothetical protein